MYDVAVMKKAVGHKFDAAVDLWSLAVTIYQVATGQLPFQPFGGRKNRTTMYVHLFNIYSHISLNNIFDLCVCVCVSCRPIKVVEAPYFTSAMACLGKDSLTGPNPI